MHQTLHLCMFMLRGPPYGCGLPMRVCLICLAWAALWLRSPYVRVLNMFGMGCPMAADALWGVCLIRLTWAALWLRTPHGRVLNMFGMGRPMAAAVFQCACLIYIWHGQPCGSGSHEGPRVQQK